MKIAKLIRLMTNRFRVLCCLLGIPVWAIADASQICLMMDETAGTELRLEINAYPLKQALDEIAKSKGILIHYSALPPGKFKLTCRESSATDILKCLLDKKADMVLRYDQTASGGKQKNQLAEVWVTGTESVADQEPTNIDLAAEKQVIAEREQAINTRVLDRESLDKLLEMTTEKNPQFRADAVTTLAFGAQSKHPLVQQAMETALSDQNPEVRAQAVLGLADDAALLASALQDGDASVRLMAVDSAGNNAALLEQAMSDRDETVRAYAAMKLDALATR